MTSGCAWTIWRTSGVISPFRIASWRTRAWPGVREGMAAGVNGEASAAFALRAGAPARITNVSRTNIQAKRGLVFVCPPRMTLPVLAGDGQSD